MIVLMRQLSISDQMTQKLTAIGQRTDFNNEHFITCNEFKI